jgi:hypothetical protein
MATIYPSSLSLLSSPPPKSVLMHLSDCRPVAAADQPGAVRVDRKLQCQCQFNDRHGLQRFLAHMITE